MLLYLTIATINCRGLRDPARRLAFFAYARKLDVQVLCLQETYSQPRDEPKWQNEWGDKNQAVFNSNTESSRKRDAGTAILLNHPLLKFGSIRKDSEGRKQLTIRVLVKILAQGLIVSMQLVTSMQFLRVFCQTNSLIMTQ